MTCSVCEGYGKVCALIKNEWKSIDCPWCKGLGTVTETEGKNQRDLRNRNKLITKKEKI